MEGTPCAFHLVCSSSDGARLCLQHWLTGAVLSGTVPDAIVDAHHMTEYLKHSATRTVLTRSGKESGSGKQLTSVRLPVSIPVMQRLTVPTCSLH